MSVDVSYINATAYSDARPSMSGPQAESSLDTGLIAMDTDVMSARGYNSDVEDGLRLAADDRDADDMAAVPWPQLPLPDLGSNDVLAGGGSFPAAAGGSGSTADPTAVNASPAALLDTPHTNGAPAHGSQTAAVATDAMRPRLGGSYGAGVKAGEASISCVPDRI
jgi:hypothetical protein